MRRALFAVVAGLMVVALVAPIAAAMPATSFVAKASAGAPGGHLHVMAKVKHPVRGSTPFKATAVVHFAAGDQTVDLNRHGRSFVAGAKVAIPAGQPLGTVGVDVTITYNSLVANPALTFNAKIEPDTTD